MARSWFILGLGGELGVISRKKGFFGRRCSRGSYSSPDSQKARKPKSLPNACCVSLSARKCYTCFLEYPGFFHLFPLLSDLAMKIEIYIRASCTLRDIDLQWKSWLSLCFRSFAGFYVQKCKVEIYANNKMLQKQSDPVLVWNHIGKK